MLKNIKGRQGSHLGNCFCVTLSRLMIYLIISDILSSYNIKISYEILSYQDFMMLEMGTKKESDGKTK